MSIEVIAGGIAVLVLLAVIAAALYAGGALEYLGGKRTGPSPKPKDKLLTRLLAINCPGLPYQVRRGKSTDIVIEWKIVDADWHEVLAQERMKMTYLAFLRLDEERQSVRYWEISGRVDWSRSVAGLPQVMWRREFFWRRLLSRGDRGAKYGIKGDGSSGRVYEDKFDIRYVRDPVVKVVQEMGWEFVPVLKRRHARY